VLRTCSWIAPALAIATFLSGAGAQARQQARPAPTLPTPGSYRIPRATSQVEIDAVLDEQAWRDALTVELNYEVQPGENTPAPVCTQALVTFDDHALYVAFRAFDPEPSRIRAHVKDRDQAFRDDFVGLIVDTFNDKRRGYEFFVNALGTQGDLSRNEVTSGNVEDETWDAIWDSAGRITRDGYVVEMGIPFTSLRFPKTEGEQTWRIAFFRAYPRSVRHQLFQVPLDRDNNCFFCQVPEYTGISGITPGHSIELDPTVTSERSGALEDEDDLTSPFRQDSFHTEAGLSARWGITPNLSLNVAANPDFSQVEADAAQLATNTRFALFYPEKRPFFLEGADFFSTPINAVYTRTVADPSWGLKLSGKQGSQGLGVFVAEDRLTTLTFPANHSSDSTTLNQENRTGVIRYRRDVGESSTVGVLATARTGDDYSNGVAGVDGLIRLTKSDTLQAQALASRTRYPHEVVADYDQPSGTFDGSALSLGYDHHTRDWGAWFFYQDLARGFRADSGYVPRVDTRTLNPGAWRVFWGGKDDWYTRLEIDLEGVRTTDHSGRVTDESVAATGYFEGLLQSTGILKLSTGKEFYDGITYHQGKVHLFFNVRPTGDLTCSIEADYGDAVDYDNSRPARQLRLEPGLTYDIGRHLYVQLDHTFEDLDETRGRLYRANLTDLRLVYQVNLRAFVRAIVQRLDVRRNLALYVDQPTSPFEQLFTQLLFSYKLNPRTVFFLGYSDTKAGTERIDVTQKDRTVFVKLGYAWLL
jgi:hypothetical protein